MATYPIIKKTEWGAYVTPKLLRKAPIHRWLVFPHSFTPELVDELIRKWNLNENDKILDPFAGAGTTLIASQQAKIPAVGYDISPFAIFAAKVKTSIYDYSYLCSGWHEINKNLNSVGKGEVLNSYPELVRNAFSPAILLAFENTKYLIRKTVNEQEVVDFFLLALLAIIPKMSRAQATGGWLKWVEKEPSIEDFISAFSSQVECMMNDVETQELENEQLAVAKIADARFLPDEQPSFSAVITSPPYPNRHDYTRVFGVELMFEFLDWDQTRALRYQSIHSHPEANPVRPPSIEYVQPKKITESLIKIEKQAPKRISKMLEGYFLDLFCCFKEMKRVTMENSPVAVVLGNAQYYGEQILVDELAAELGEQAGLSCEEIVTARLRGNSAQQMKKFGRIPSRESIVLFRS